MTTEQLTVTVERRHLQAAVAGPESGPLLIVHGGTPEGVRELYAPHVATAAQRGLRLASYARPGYGDSDRLEGRTVADCAADCAAVADALGAERFYTVGGSGGGPHALACAALIGDRVIAAATIAGVAPTDAEGLEWRAGMASENLEEFAAADAGPAALEAFLDHAARSLGSITAEQVIDSLGSLVSAPDAAVLTGDFAAFVAADLHDALRSGIWGWLDDDLALLGPWGFELDAIEVPVDVWQGLEDRFVPASHGEWLVANVAGARPHILSAHGHLSLGLGCFGEILDGLLADA